LQEAELPIPDQTIPTPAPTTDIPIPTLEYRLRTAWDHKITAVTLGIAAFIAVCLFLRHSPVPGVAIAVLGVVAAVMSIRALSSYEKVFWTLMAFGLLYAEIRAIRVDRAEQTRHALEDRAAQDEHFLALRKAQDEEFLATKTGINSLQSSFDSQFIHKTVSAKPVSDAVKPASPKPVDSNSQNPINQSVPLNNTQQAVVPAGGGLRISQTNEVSTRTDAPYKIKVVIQFPADMPSLKFALKCNVPIIEAQGGSSQGGMLMMTAQGIAREDNTVWLFQYANAAPPIGPANPISVNIWSSSPIVCNQARTF
jgi:hypothetical protein